MRAIAQDIADPREPNLNQHSEFTPPVPGTPPTPITVPYIRNSCPYVPELEGLDVQLAIQSASNPAHITHRRPIFALQLPEAATTEQIFFNLRDDSDTTLYQTFVSIADQGNRLQVTLPESVSDLELNHHYYVAFAIPCDGRTLRPDSPFIMACVSQTEQGAILPGEERDRRRGSGSSGVYLDCPEVD